MMTLRAISTTSLLVLLASACSETRAAERVTERVTVDLDARRLLSGLADPATPRADRDGTWVLSETRDAVPARWGERVPFATTLVGRVTVQAGFAVKLLTPTPSDARVSCELRLVSSGRDEVLARLEIALADAAHGWTDVAATVEIAPGSAARLELVADWTGNAAPIAGVQAWIARPRVLAHRGERRNVLVISVDTLRADHLGFHGYERDTSPRLDDFVARGAFFESAISTSPWTLPSYGTLFTGLEPTRHLAGISERREAAFGADRDAEGGDYQSLDPGVPTLSECFGAAGFSTAAFVSNPFLDPASGVDRGFDSYAQYLNRAQAGVELASRWIESRGDAPWFAFLHLMDPHAPYSPPAPFDTQFTHTALRDLPGGIPSVESLRAAEPDSATRDLLLAAYDGEIAYVDTWIGRLLDRLEALGVLDRTIVVLHADHGEEFWEHGGFEHGHALHEESLHVPLAFVAPGIVAPGLRVGGRTSTVNAFATILDLAGVPVPLDLDGVSSAPLLRIGQYGTVRIAPRPCISESILYGPRERKAWSFGAEKLITNGATDSRFYDLVADPSEGADLALDRPERVRELSELLLGRARMAERRRAAGSTANFDPERRAELERLGYPGATDH